MEKSPGFSSPALGPPRKLQEGPLLCQQRQLRHLVVVQSEFSNKTGTLSRGHLYHDYYWQERRKASEGSPRIIVDSQTDVHSRPVQCAQLSVSNGWPRSMVVYQPRSGEDSPWTKLSGILYFVSVP